MTGLNKQLYNAIKGIIQDERVPLNIRNEYREKLVRTISKKG
jgi:uncharacterized protein (UPF0147 family)